MNVRTESTGSEKNGNVAPSFQSSLKRVVSLKQTDRLMNRFVKENVKQGINWGDVR